MSFKHIVDFECDGCGQRYSLESGELPPRWIGVQIAMANTEGDIPKHEQKCFSHFCSLECLLEFAKSDDLRERFLLSDVVFEEDIDEDEEGENENEDTDEENNEVN